MTMSQRTLLQFSLRSLLVITSAVAVLCAIFAPLVHGLRPAQQLKLAVFLAGTTLVAAVFLVALCYGRWKIEQRSGKLLLRARIRRRKWQHVGGALFAVLALSCWFAMLVDVVSSKGTTAWRLLLTGQPIIFIYSIVSYFVVTWWWGLDSRAIEAREKGLILGGRRFLPWSKIKSHRWGGASPYRLTLQLHQVVVNLQVGPRDKEPLDSLLNERIGDFTE